MALILAGIYSLAQHLQQLNLNFEAYRPERCPHCGCAGMWYHGYYTRKADREEGSAFNPTPIPRFLCPRANCRKSCSVLPECIPPKRWYLWSIQQAMLSVLLSHQLCEEQVKPHVRTVWRWWARLKARFKVHRFYLANHWAQLGQHGSIRAFWSACFARMAFSRALFFIHRHAVDIP